LAVPLAVIYRELLPNATGLAFGINSDSANPDKTKIIINFLNIESL
jgi:hypothetical protein